ncbi:N-acetyltransferase [Psychrobacter sp. F1192]|uniref:N-acetyltransferase n=1 Tax=Psychrobacter coccoides TaxID=2818440 RepID=A0ABS3NML1_9GAMM|nr:GNAT family N-acetyltransferase [Psychrobacter coccoides]MBO1530446.1 N-acetyltransferase [Psychrobacter coccoides]
MNNQADSQDLNITHNTEAKRFETTVEDHTGYISYQERGDTLIYDHTLVPQALGGRGIGSKLVKHALDYAQHNDKKVVSQCSFVSAYIDRHPEYQSLL